MSYPWSSGELLRADDLDAAFAERLLTSGGTVTGDLIASGTGSWKVPVGTTAQRPNAGEVGHLRYNTTTGRQEFGTGSAWVNHTRLTGDVMTGALTITTGGFLLGTGAGAGQTLSMVSTSGTSKFHQWFTGGTGAANLRWRMGSNSDAESTGNAGSNFSLTAYDDAGAAVGGANVFTVTRATRRTQFLGSLEATRFTMAGTNGLGAAYVWPSGAESNTLSSPIFINQSISGVGPPVNNMDFNSIIVNDTAQYPGAGGGNALRLAHRAGGVGSQGGRQALYITMEVNAPTTIISQPDFFNGATIYTAADASAGGTALDAVGNVCGLNPWTQLQAGATFWAGLTGMEMDFTAATGCSYLNRTGILFATIGGHAVSGSNGHDSVMTIGGNGALTGAWDYGVTFCNPQTQWQWKTTSTLLWCGEPQSPLFSQARCAWGIDFTGPLFSGGFAKSIGFTVDGSGNTTTQRLDLSNWRASHGATGMTLDVSGQRCTAAAISAAGSGYAAGDKVTTATGGTYLIDTAKLLGVTRVSGGSGGANGAVTIRGTTGTGTRFEATGTIAGGVLQAALVLTIPGSYTVSPPSYSVEPVVAVVGGAGLTGATVSFNMGALTVTQLVADVSAAPPANPVATVATNDFGAGLYHPAGAGLTLNLTWAAGDGLTLGGTAAKLAAYGGTPIAKPTGVAISAAGIHAALVSLNLIAP